MTMPDTVLKPCPHGKKALVLNIGGGDAPFSIVVRPEHRCVNREIGWYASRNEAIAAWNALPRTPSSATPELVELRERLQKREHYFLNASEGEYDANLLRRARFALETLEARVKLLEEALGDLADAARNSCDARRHPALTEALFDADAALLKQLSGDGE